MSLHKFNLDVKGENSLGGSVIMNECFNETKGEEKMFKTCLVIIGRAPVEDIFIQVKEYRY